MQLEYYVMHPDGSFSPADPQPVLRPRQPAQAFHPGEFMRDEMAARGWSHETMARESLLLPRTIEELAAQRIAVTPVVADCLARAFGTSSEYWMELQRSFSGA